MDEDGTAKSSTAKQRKAEEKAAKASRRAERKVGGLECHHSHLDLSLLSSLSNTAVYVDNSPRSVLAQSLR